MKVKIVLACSDECQTNQIVSVIEKQGWQVIVAGTSSEALSQIEQNLPLAAIIYASLTDMTGLEVIEKMRQNSMTREIVGIVVTPANPVNNGLPHKIATGVDVALHEPVAPMAFVDCLLRVMQAQFEGETVSQI